MDIVQFGGWEKCARLVSGDVELIVTLEVGPRVLFLGKRGGINLLYPIPGDAGQTGGDEYRFYGGHRIWIAPEDAERSMQPDNDPVEYVVEGEVHRFKGRPDKYHVSKELAITVSDDGAFSLAHSITNHSPYSIELAVWCPTQCAPGKVHFPQPPFQTHVENLLPTRPLVMWSYTKLSDPRWTWGDRAITLRQDPARGPQKIGAFVPEGFAAFEGEGGVFLKTFGAEPGAKYPDMGCNFETFTNEDFIEIESLGKVVRLDPFDGSECHKETWAVFPNEILPTEDAALADRLAALAEPFRIG